MGSHLLDRDCVGEETRRQALLATRGTERRGGARLRIAVATLVIRAGTRLHGEAASGAGAASRATGERAALGR